MNSLDLSLGNYIESIRSPFVTEFTVFISSMFNFTTSAVIIVLLFTYLIWLYFGRKFATLFFGNIFVGNLIVYMMKIFFAISRPTNAVITELDKSFPSGHATMSTIFFLTIIYILKSKIKNFWLYILSIFGIAMIILVSFSRIYLGVHWLSDVVAGIILGLIICFVSFKLYGRAKRHDNKR